MRSMAWVKRNIRAKKKSIREPLFTDIFSPQIPGTFFFAKSGRVICVDGNLLQSGSRLFLPTYELYNPPKRRRTISMHKSQSNSKVRSRRKGGEG